MKRLIGGLLLLQCTLACLAAPAADAALQRLLFADVPLGEVAKMGDGPAASSWSHFARASEALQGGDAESARKELMAATAARETRVQLLAWNALRELGVQPEAEDAWIIRGVVVERHHEGGVGTVAVYEDGRARWLDAKGGGGVWDSPGGSREMSRLVKTVIAAAEPVMKSTRPMPHYDTTPVAKDRVRLTVLTYSGFYVVDTYGPDVTEQHPVAAPVAASAEIVQFLEKAAQTP